MKGNTTSSLELGLINRSYHLNASLLNESLTKFNNAKVFIAKLEKCLLIVFSIFLFFAVYNCFAYSLQNPVAYESISLPDEIRSIDIEPQKKAAALVPPIPEEQCHPGCDPAFIKKYSKKLGFNLRCDISKGLILAASKWLGKQHTAKVGEAGIDCSGFVRNVFKEAYNTNLNVCAADMYTKYSKPISRKQLRQGDLVFFNINGEEISHVGIYLQDNKFIHTSYSSGVRVSSLDSKYYSQRFYAAGRIL